MSTITIKLPAGDQASRHSAAKIRRQILSEFTTNTDRIDIDISESVTVSESFADELFGILFVTLSAELFFRLVHVNVYDSRVLATLATVLRNRVSRQDEVAVKDIAGRYAEASNELKTPEACTAY